MCAVPISLLPPRDAAKRGLKRIMTLGGAYGTRNCTVKDLREGRFPGPEHVVNASQDMIGAFVEAVDNNG